MSWKPINESPVTGNDALRVLVYSPEFGVQMGRVYRYADGSIHAYGNGFNGDWGVTHFHELPEPPQ